MALVELLLLAGEDDVERVSDALIELGALSVSVEDADADTASERALFGEPGLPAAHAGWTHSRLAALFSDDAAATSAATLLLAQPWAAAVQVHGVGPLVEQDWVRLTQSQFAPVEITPSFWIVPSWHEAPAGAEQAMRLDPGLAFGTGTHPTTRMCLRWIARHTWLVADARVLDYGCGSGILAIGAAMFGAARIDAIDIDPAAVQSTFDNAAANGIAAGKAAAARPPHGGRLRVGLPELAGSPTGGYDLVLANILASPLELLAPMLTAHVAPGGRLVLAGILARQAAQLQAAYAPAIALAVSDEEDGWILMTAQRRAPLPAA